MRIGKANRSTRTWKKSDPEPVCVPEINDDLLWDRTMSRHFEKLSSSILVFEASMFSHHAIISKD
jgi:hypothetical protein